MNYRRSSFDIVLALIGINVAIFIATLFKPDAPYTLGLTPALFTAQPWTLLTAMFLHASWLHILANMITLYFFGTYLAQIVGDGWLLATYFIGGIAGNLLFVALAPTYSIAVGASGAIFALAGALAVLRPSARVFIIPIPVPMPMWIAVIGSFVVLSFIPGVAWQAHLGGLATGLVSGYLFSRRRAGRYR